MNIQKIKQEKTNRDHVIKSLNDEIEDLKVKHAQNEKAMEEIEQKNAKLSEPLEATQKEVKELQLALTNYDKDKISLKHARSRLTKMDEVHKALEDELGGYANLTYEFSSKRSQLHPCAHACVTL